MRSEVILNLVFLLICVVAGTKSAQHSNYSLILSVGKGCFNRDSCEGTSGLIVTDWSQRNCFCDNQCHLYGDCCIDAPYKVQSSGTKFECVKFKQYGPVYVSKRCPLTWKDIGVRLACEHPNVLRDPLGSLPVTSRKSGITYSNLNCFVCNYENYHDLQIWNATIECPSLSSLAPFLNISDTDLAENLQYDDERQVWEVEVKFQGIRTFHTCTIEPAAPRAISVRLCIGNDTVDACPADYGNEEIRHLCQSYTALLFSPRQVFKNAHCAICNNASLDSLNCYSMDLFSRMNWQDNFETFSFAVLMDLSSENGDQVGFRKVNCNDGELYDVFFRKCRPVFCSSGNFSNGKCVTQQRDEIVLTTPLPDGVELITLFPDTILLDTLMNLTSSHREDGWEQDHFSQCPKVELTLGEFQSLNSSHVFIEKQNKILCRGEFQLKDNNRVLVICASSIETTDKLTKFGPQLSYITVVCISISIIALILHLIATLILPDLHNLSGKNLFSLCIALLGSYLTFLAAMFKGSNVDNNSADESCFVLAVLMYFFFMSAFLWMLVIAFDICWSLRLATRNLRINVGSQWKKFFAYSSFAWITAVSLAFVTIIVERMDVPVDYKPGFGQSSICWFSNKRALFIYFAAPFATIMAFNVFFFLYSGWIVGKSMISDFKIKSLTPETNFYLFVKLAVIMGLAWVVGLIAGSSEFEPLWYVFVVLNALQGLFIFVTFTCSNRNRKGLRQRLGFILTSREPISEENLEWSESLSKSQGDAGGC